MCRSPQARRPDRVYHRTMETDWPRGLSGRAATRSDVDAIVALVAACEVANDGVAEVHPSDVAQSIELAAEGAGAILVEAPDQLVGWAAVTGARAEADVHPAWRGRGLGYALLGWCEARARASGALQLQQIVTNSDEGANSLFAWNGYRVHHTSWILRMELSDEPPHVTVPQEITIRPYRADDAQATYRLIEDAFNEWPDRRPTDFEGWSAHVLRHPSFAPWRSRLAFDDGLLVGAALCDEYEGQEEGWVQQVATRVTHRRRGIARALLQSVFTAYHTTGRRSVGLSTGSQMGALAPYERIGMRVRRTYTAWAKDLVGDGGG